VLVTAGSSRRVAPWIFTDRPQNTFVAGFIGSPAMTFWRAWPGAADSSWATDRAPSWSSPGCPRPPDGSRLTLGLAARAPAGASVPTPIWAFPLRCGPSSRPDRKTLVRAQAAGRSLTVLVRERLQLRRVEMIRLLPDPGQAHCSMRPGSDCASRRRRGGWSLSFDAALRDARDVMALEEQETAMDRQDRYDDWQPAGGLGGLALEGAALRGRCPLAGSACRGWFA
jgi:hypothetical protein